MKTINQALDEAYKNAGQNAYFGRGFNEGVQFAESWIPVDEELPTCFESGAWDGLRSDFVIVKYKDGDWAKARLYSGIIDGREFNDWANEDDYILCNIIGWRPLNRK